MAPLGTKTVSTRLTVAVPGREPATAVSRSYVVTPGYAEALRLRLRTGRLLTAADSTLPTVLDETHPAQHQRCPPVCASRSYSI